MGKNNIEKYDFFYHLLKIYVGFWHNNIYYRKVITYGKENIDYSASNIFAPNHQNALMDALAVVFTTKGQMVFLARADIFKKKFIASLLHFIKMLPVFRIRDGYENLKLNDETFQDTYRVMEHHTGLGILPEGNHDGHRRLRQLKKGICRIAFQAAEASDFKLNIKIVPVGLEFTHYWRFRQVLTVVYGRSIAVSDYYDSYRENPQKAFIELRDRLSSEMKKLMVHIESEEDYDAINELRSIVNDKYSDSLRYPKLFRDKGLVSKMNELRQSDTEEYRRICDESLTVRDMAAKLNLTYRHLRKKKHPLLWLLLSVLFLLVTLPVFIVGALLNIIMFEIPNIQALRIKDKQFMSSIRYGLTVGISLIMMPIYIALAFIFIKPWWLALAAFLAIPFSGLLAWNWLLLMRRTIGGLKIRYLRMKKNPEYILLRKTYDSLMAKMTRL